jgi:diguanylate cyclase (GGDEF)-like protein/PAS domain S-box-containing protein
MAEHWVRTHSILRGLYRNPWFVVLVGLLVTSLLFVGVRKASMDDFRSRFEAGSAARGTRIIHEMNEVVLVMQALSHFVAGADKMDRTGFRAMATPFLLARKDLKAVAWVPALSGVEAGLYRVALAEPLDVRREVEGNDLGTEPALLATLARTRDTGEAAACTWLGARKGKGRPELIVFLPVYRNGRVPATEGERKASIQGFLLGFLELEPIMAYVLATVQPDGLAVEFLDASAGPCGTALYTWSARPMEVTGRWITPLLPSQPPYQFRAAFGGHEWTMRVTPSQEYIKKYCSLGHWLILPLGIALTFLLALYRRSFMSQWRLMEDTVEQRTAEVRAHEQRLEDLVTERTDSLSRKTAFLEAITETSWDGILVTDSRGRRVLENKRLAALWGAPDSAAGWEEDEWAEFAVSRVKNPLWFREHVLPLLFLPHGSLRDEVELLDGTVLEMYSSAILGSDGNRYGRIWTFHDVTERKSAEEALKRSEATLRSVLAASPVGIALVGPDRLPTWVSESMVAITGYDFEEVVAGGPQILYPAEEEYLRVGETLYRQVADGPVGSVDTKMARKDGRVIDISLRAAAIEPGNLSAGVVLALVDITERKRAEEALRESENMFRDLAEKSVLGISLVQDGRYKYVNAQFAAIHGHTVEEMTGMEAGLTYIHPEDLGHVTDTIGSNPPGGHKPMEFRIVGNQGEVRAVLAYASPTTHGGRPATVATLLDLTGRRKAEEAVRENEVRLSHAMNLAKIVYWEHDEVRREFVFNDAFYALYGTTAEQEGGYKMSRDEYFRRFVHPEDLRDARTRADDNRKRPDTPEELEHRVIRRDGAIIHIVTRMKLFRDGEGRVVKVIGANQDITERKGTEETLLWKTAFLEAQVNSSPDGILVVDRHGKTILRNQRMRDIWKHPREFVPGLEDKAQLEHDISMTLFPQLFEEKVTFLHGHPNETSRDEVKLKDGTVLDVFSCPVQGKEGSYYGRIWTFRDVTELRRYWDMLESLSTTDGLTELPNRRRFDEFLNREWRRSMRDQSLLSLILMDIDFFKEFNDHYGHLAGDDCLRQVANVLSEIVRRPGDLVARYGGEEFACILPSTDLKGAIAVANTVRNRLAEASIPHYYSSVADHVSLSFGVATLIPETGQTPSLLIQLADDLLYSAKQNGRDRILSWQRVPSREKTQTK